MSKSAEFTICLLPKGFSIVQRTGSTSSADEEDDDIADNSSEDCCSLSRQSSSHEESTSHGQFTFNYSFEQSKYEDDDVYSEDEEPDVPRYVFRLRSTDDQAIDEFSCLDEESPKISFQHAAYLEEVFEDEECDQQSELSLSVCTDSGLGSEASEFKNEFQQSVIAPSPEPVTYLDGSDSETLKNILKWLPFRERVKCERVSQAWKKCVGEVNAKVQTSLGLFGGRFDKIQNFCPQNNHRVYASDCVEINWYMDIQQVLKKVPHLKSLHIRCEGSPIFRKDGDPQSIGKLCPKLEHLSFVDDLAGVNIYDHIIEVFTSCSTIKHLQLRFPYKASSAITDQLALESVIVKRGLYVYNRNLDILSINVPLNEEHCKILANWCKLRKLSLHGTTIPIQGFEVLFNDPDVRCKSTMTNLRCLSIVVDSTEQLKMICKHMPMLHSFHCVVNNEAKKMAMKSISWIGQLKNLKNLFLSCWSDEICDDGMIGIIMGCSNLMSLTINADVSDTSLKYLGNFCPFIERLEINNAKANIVNDISIFQSIAHLEHLRFLTLYYCNISDEGVECLLDLCKELEYVSITYSARVTEDSLKYIKSFASEKPYERVTAIMPRSLTRYRHVVAPLPRNLSLSFVK